MLEKRDSKTVLVAPAMESLLFGGLDSLWPAAIQDNADVALQTNMRRKLLAVLDSLFGRMADPTTDISVAVEAGTVSPEAATELYDLLAAFLDADPYHRRLVLYFPFELIPARTWRPASPVLLSALDNFIRAYLGCWRELLRETDVRANFVNGDILEPELSPNGQVPVRKAAHLIPFLVAKGLVSAQEAIALMDGSSSEILQSSIADTLPLLVRMSLLSEQECERALQSHGFPSLSVAKTIVEKKINRAWLDELPGEIAFELKKIAMRAALDQARGMPPARIAWEKRDREDAVMCVAADRIASAVAMGSVAWEDVLPFLSPTVHDTVFLSVIRGLGIAAEKLAKTDRKKATDLSRAYMARVRTLAMDDAPSARDELEDVLTRWASLGIITEAHLRRFGLGRPALDAAFSEKEPLAAEVRKFAEATEMIDKDSRLSRFLYPVALFFGSRLKRYARRKADLDVAVFVKPGVPIAQRGEIQQILAQTFKSEKIDGKIVEFWLEEQGSEYWIRDFPDPDVLLADSTWIHVLLAGIWLGRQGTVKDIHAKLLSRFLQPEGRLVEGRDARMFWLGEIEREVLQYRLMHKGYRRFFPPQGGIDGPGAERLDPQSAFWDSGYRRLATKLFVMRVFLPRLK